MWCTVWNRSMVAAVQCHQFLVQCQVQLIKCYAAFWHLTKAWYCRLLHIAGLTARLVFEGALIKWSFSSASTLRFCRFSCCVHPASFKILKIFESCDPSPFCHLILTLYLCQHCHCIWFTKLPLGHRIVDTVILACCLQGWLIQTSCKTYFWQTRQSQTIVQTWSGGPRVANLGWWVKSGGPSAQQKRLSVYGISFVDGLAFMESPSCWIIYLHPFYVQWCMKWMLILV